MVSCRLVGLRYVVLGSVCFSVVLLSFVLLRYVISTSPPGMLRHFLYFNKRYTCPNHSHVPTYVDVDPLIPKIQSPFVVSTLTRLKCNVHSLCYARLKPINSGTAPYNLF